MFGRFKAINREKGFGFITTNGNGQDIFCHVSSLVGLEWSESLVGLRVEFSIEATDRGPRAVNVHSAE